LNLKIKIDFILKRKKGNKMGEEKILRRSERLKAKRLSSISSTSSISSESSTSSITSRTSPVKYSKNMLPPKFKFKKEVGKRKVSKVSKVSKISKDSKVPKVISRTKNGEDNGNMFELEKNKEFVEKIDKIDWSDWVSATQTKNYLMDDGFLDVLQYNSTNIIKANPNYAKDIGRTIGLAANGKGFVPNVMNSGNVFETKVLELLTKELGEKNIVNIGGNHSPRSTEKYKETIKCIQKGVPLIFQAILRNYENKTYGIADILIRSDWINKFTDINSLNPEEVKVPAKNLKKNYHYIVIDIKYKSLILRSDGIHLRNDSSFKAYKSQLWVYNLALSKIQGYLPPYAFILGSKWKYTSKNITFEGKSCFDKLGRIDYNDLDEIYIEKTEKAIKWLNDVKKNEYDLSKYPLPRDELYPNMCNRLDYPYHGIKKTFAENNKDLSLLWNIGPKQRRIANKNGIYSWDDPNCTSENLGVKGKKRSRVLDRILEANHSEGKNIYPKYIRNNFGDWKNYENRELELFVDFETTCSIFNELEDLPLNTGEALIFLIGAGYIHPKTNKWIFQEFIVDSINEKEEARICLDFVKFVNNLAIQFKIKKSIHLWHYSHAEVSSWKRFEERNQKGFDMPWTDLLKVFLQEPIGVKGALNYGLKTISKTFYQHGYIQTIWDDGEVGNGADAAVSAYKVDLECKKTGKSFASHELAKEIVKYNEIDCKVLQEILFYLRENHISLDVNEDIEEIEEIETVEDIEEIETIETIEDIESIEEIEDSSDEYIELVYNKKRRKLN
jgi:hypothetical protein